MVKFGFLLSQYLIREFLYLLYILEKREVQCSFLSLKYNLMIGDKVSHSGYCFVVYILYRFVIDSFTLLINV